MPATETDMLIHRIKLHRESLSAVYEEIKNDYYGASRDISDALDSLDEAVEKVKRWKARV
jgi:hypothetical protein